MSIFLSRRRWKTLRQTRISGKIYHVRIENHRFSASPDIGFSGGNGFRAAVTIALYYDIYVYYTYPRTILSVVVNEIVIHVGRRDMKSVSLKERVFEYLAGC